MRRHPLYRVTWCKVVGPFVVSVRFDDGVQQRIDFRPVLRGELYGELRDPAVFERVRIDPDSWTLVWPNGADFDPATLHDWPDTGPRLIEMARRWAEEERPGGDPGEAARGSLRIIGIDCASRRPLEDSLWPRATTTSCVWSPRQSEGQVERPSPLSKNG